MYDSRKSKIQVEILKKRRFGNHTTYSCKHQTHLELFCSLLFHKIKKVVHITFLKKNPSAFFIKKLLVFEYASIFTKKLAT
jgi:hypothetical protein